MKKDKAVLMDRGIDDAVKRGEIRNNPDTLAKIKKRKMMSFELCTNGINGMLATYIIQF